MSDENILKPVITQTKPETIEFDGICQRIEIYGENFTSDSEAELEIKYMLSVNAKCSYKVDGDKVTVTPKQILDDDTNEYRDITDEDLEMWDDINGDIIFTIVNDKKITTDSFDNWGEGLELTK